MLVTCAALFDIAVRLGLMIPQGNLIEGKPLGSLRLGRDLLQKECRRPPSHIRGAVDLGDLISSTQYSIVLCRRRAGGVQL